nr:peptidase C48, SUMO/sentrin/Ubl1 [Tanacetum cinerariifolium]
MLGVKAINRVPSIKSKLKDTGKINSPIKSKLKDIGKSNSPKSRWVSMSEKVFSPQSVTQYNPITGEVRKEIEKSTVDDDPKVFKVLDKSNMSAVVAPVIDNVPVATETDKETEPIVAAVESVVEKHNPKVTSKVSDESIKESVKVLFVKKSVKASSVVTDKLSSENQDKIDLVANKHSSLVADKVDVIVKKSVKASSLVADKFDVVKDKVDVVADKASDALKNKLTGKGKKPVVGEDMDKPKNIAPDVVKEKFKPNSKQKVISSEIPVLRLSKQEENPKVNAKVNVKRKMILSKEHDRKKKLKGKLKKDVSDSELETGVVDYSSDEADRKRKKLKIKASLKRKRSGSDFSDSSEIDTKSIKLLISKLEKKVKKQEFDEDSVPKKFKKKLSKKIEKEVKKEESDEDSIPKKGKKKKKQLTPKEAAHEEYLSSFPSFHARTTPSSLFSAIKNSRVDILRFLTDIGFSSLHNVSIDHLPSKLGWFAVSKFKSYVLIFDSGDKIEVTPSKIHDMLGVPLGGYSLFDLDERETDHEFTLHEDSVISNIDWCGYIYDCLRDSKLPGGTNHYLGPLTFLIVIHFEFHVIQSLSS